MATICGRRAARWPSSPAGARSACWPRFARSAGNRAKTERNSPNGSTVEPLMDDLPLAFVAQQHDPPALEVRINFGVATGRTATPAEVDRLAALLLDEVGDV